MIEKLVLLGDTHRTESQDPRHCDSATQSTAVEQQYDVRISRLVGQWSFPLTLRIVHDHNISMYLILLNASARAAGDTETFLLHCILPGGTAARAWRPELLARMRDAPLDMATLVCVFGSVAHDGH